MTVHKWQGASGTWYDHVVHAFGSAPYVAANYVFVRCENGLCYPLYIGQSDNFGARFAVHDKRMLALSMGANQVHLHFGAPDSNARFRIETDLRNGHPAPLNQQGLGLFSR